MCSAKRHVRFTPESGNHRPIKVVSEILRLSPLRGALAERFGFDRNYVAFQALLNS